MAEITEPTPLSTAGSTPDGDIQWVRSASDVSRLVNDGSQGRANARIVVGIALGGIFLDAYDLGALAFGIKDITREFNLTPAGTGMVASAITFGAIVGALLGGYLVTGPHEPYMVVVNGVAREDESAIARTWQLLMLLQLPAILVFAVKWLPRDPRRASMMIGLHGLAFIAAALPVYLLEH